MHCQGPRPSRLDVKADGVDRNARKPLEGVGSHMVVVAAYKDTQDIG